MARSRRLSLTQAEFAGAFGIPASRFREYELARYMPPPAVRAYLAVIEAEPEMVRGVMPEPVVEPA